jgi:ubiquinone/menaquinone biosynthesis C-methylase UbiE
MEELYFKIFEALPRQGPGDEESTTRAFQKLSGLPDYPNLLDVGCGTGSQTLVLAKLITGPITALDNHAPFIDILKNKTRLAGLENRIHCIVQDMATMSFPGKRFDLIWSEGAAYNIGFENALKSWNPLLARQGYLVVSELVWSKRNPPLAVREYFAQEYPVMRYYQDIYPIIKAAGYKMIDNFRLPGESWWTDYYTPIEKILADMKQKYRSNEDAQSVFNAFELEIQMHREYSEYYGYHFYIMKKIQ